MSHFSVVVVTKKPEDVGDALSPFDENRTVDSYPEVLGAVADAASSARSGFLSTPESVPPAVLQWYFDRYGFTKSTYDRLNLETIITPGDKPGDKTVWRNPDGARTVFAEIPDEVLTLAQYDDYEGVRIEGDKVVYDSTCNPRGYWDWWVIGGRWRGFFHRKPTLTSVTYRLPETSRARDGDTDWATAGMPVIPGDALMPGEAVIGSAGVGEWLEQRELGHPTEDYTGRADQLQWRDVDLDAIRDHARTKASEQYDAYETATVGVEPPSQTFSELADSILTARGLPTDWAEFREITRSKREKDDSDAWRKSWDAALTEARTRWRIHPWIRALREAKIDPDDDPIGFYCIHTGGRDEYIRRATASAGVPYAIVIDGKWISRGRMGWFGSSADTATRDEWNTTVHDLYAQLDDDVWVTAVDCHI
jgi:hypothetical protein